MFITFEEMCALYKWFKHGADALTPHEDDLLAALIDRVGRNIKLYKYALDTGRPVCLK